MAENLSLMMLQPGYFPWIGFFEQIFQTDIFVAYDDTQYTKQDWRNRNRIKASNGEPIYITVPVKKNPVNTLIKDIEISYNENWQKYHVNLIRECYCKSLFFKDYFDIIKGVIETKHRFLIDLDMASIKVCMEALGLKKKIMLSSDIKIDVPGKSRMMALCKHLGAGRCYNGKAGEKLYSKKEFAENGVILEFQNFNCPEYKQPWGAFVPNLSIIDLLFNCGKAGADILAQSGRR